METAHNPAAWSRTAARRGGDKGINDDKNEILFFRFCFLGFPFRDLDSVSLHTTKLHNEAIIVTSLELDFSRSPRGGTANTSLGHARTNSNAERTNRHINHCTLSPRCSLFAPNQYCPRRFYETLLPLVAPMRHTTSCGHHTRFEHRDDLRTTQFSC